MCDSMQTTVAMVSDDRIGASFRASNLRLQGTVAGSVYAFFIIVWAPVSVTMALQNLLLHIHDGGCCCRRLRLSTGYH